MGKPARSWYRGEYCNFHPGKVGLHGEGGLEKYILQGWVPPEPFITRKHRITAFGSCFAENVRRYLEAEKYSVATEGTRNSYVVTCGFGINTTFSVRQQFDWAWLGRKFEEDLWWDEGKNLNKPLEDVREETRALFDQTDVFIITFGLSEVWYSMETGEVFWRAVPDDHFDPERHGFRLSTVEENRDNILWIRDLIRMRRPDAAIIFSLSPVPLLATFRPVSCITADAVSKAILRVALDDVMRIRPSDDLLFYFPSYEMVTRYFQDPFIDDNRHPRKEHIQEIMRTFHRHFLVGSPVTWGS